LSIPYREFIQFDTLLLYGADTATGGTPFDQQSDWSNGHSEVLRVGDEKVGANSLKTWQCLFRPSDPTYGDQDGMDSPAWLLVQFTVPDPEDNVAGVGSFYFNHGLFKTTASGGSAWDKNTATGQTYDGSNAWADFPQYDNVASGGYGIRWCDQVVVADLPETYELYAPAWDTTRANFGLPNLLDTAGWFMNGYFIRCSNYDIGDPNTWGNGDKCYVSLNVQRIKVAYFNPVVNSLSRLWSPLVGGVEVVLTGCGFDNSDADIEEGGGARGAGWNDDVDFIYFEGLQGQGTTTLSRGGGDFTVDSNTQITIPAMPPLAAGSYNLRLEKDAHDIPGADPECYAGDWNCGSDGWSYPGNRFTFLAGDYSDEDGDLILTKWTFKKKNGDTASHWFAPIDVSAPERFYEGRILSMSTLTRGIESKTGLYTISDMTVELANHDKFFSKILAEYMMKNQIVEIFRGNPNTPESFKSSVTKMIVENHSRPGPNLNVSLKDITRKYFASKVPLYFCGETDYPNIHDTGIGKPMPEILGNCTKTTGDNPGAVEAVYVDTTTFEYLAARGSLKEVSQVYSQGTLMAAGVNYDVVYKDGGRTYLVFTADQGDNAITFNAKGYMFGPWNSANGYVQSPSYIIAFYLALIKEIPIEYMDLTAFDDLHAIFTAAGYDEAGHLAIQEEKDVDDELTRLLFSFGVNQTIDLNGRVKVEKKDVSNFATDLIIYDQIDLLGPADRDDNLQEAVNYAKYKWNWNPNPASFANADEDQRSSSITDYEVMIEPSSPWEFPWTDDTDLVDDRITELLLRFGYGDYKISFDLPLRFMDDLNVLTNFRFQDPYGLSLTGAGESGRYYYVESLGYNFLEGTLNVIGLDLTWLLRQYFILGDENSLPAAWLDATESSRIYGYLCDEMDGLFSDGEPGKILIDENYL